MRPAREAPSPEERRGTGSCSSPAFCVVATAVAKCMWPMAARRGAIFARVAWCRRVRPGECEVGAKLHQLLPLHLAQGRRLPCLDGGDLALDPVHDLQRL